MKNFEISDVTFEQEDFHPKGIGSVSLDVEMNEEVLTVHGEYGYHPYHAKWGFFIDEDQKAEIEEATGLDADALEETLEEKVNDYYGVDFSRYHENGRYFEPAIYGTNLSEAMVTSILRYDEVDMDEVEAVWDCRSFVEIELPDGDIRNNPVTIKVFDHTVEYVLEAESDQMVNKSELGEILAKDGVSEHIIDKVKLAVNYLAREQTDENLNIPYSTESKVEANREFDRAAAASKLDM